MNSRTKYRVKTSLPTSAPVVTPESSLQKRVNELLIQHNETQKRITELTAKRTEQKTSLSLLKKSHDALLTDKVDISNKHMIVTEKLKAAQIEADELAKELELAKKATPNKETVTELTRQNDALQANIIQVNSLNLDLTKQYEQLQTELTKLNHDLEDSNKYYTSVLTPALKDALAKQSEQKNSMQIMPQPVINSFQSRITPTPKPLLTLFQSHPATATANRAATLPLSAKNNVNDLQRKLSEIKDKNAELEKILKEQEIHSVQGLLGGEDLKTEKSELDKQNKDLLKVNEQLSDSIHERKTQIIKEIEYQRKLISMERSQLHAQPTQPPVTLAPSYFPFFQAPQPIPYQPWPYQPMGYQAWPQQPGYENPNINPNITGNYNR